MLTLTNVLFPTDGSEAAERARRHARLLAAQYRARLHVVQVETDGLGAFVDLKGQDVMSTLPGAVSLAMDGEKSPSERSVLRSRVHHPSVAQGILDYANTHDVDLIVMASDAEAPGFGQRVTGRVSQSVAEAVARSAPCSVLVVRGTRTDPGPETFERMLVPIDFAVDADLQVARARGLARAYRAGVNLLHVVTDTELPDGTRIDLPREHPALQEKAWHRLEALATALKADGVDVMAHVREGQPAAEVVRFASEYESDLIVLTTGPRTPLERLLGGTADTILRTAPCPVLTLHRKAPLAEEFRGE